MGALAYTFHAERTALPENDSVLRQSVSRLLVL